MQGDISESLRQPNAGEESREEEGRRGGREEGRRGGGEEGGATAPHKTPLSNSVVKRIFSKFFKDLEK